MKKKSSRFFTPILWIIFFVISLLLLNEVAKEYVEPREIIISTQQANDIGKKIWQNEGSGKIENLLVWNKNEAFPSLGIGHFIWFPKGLEQPFQESFPDLIKHIAKTREIPQWLANTPFPPWQSRQDFLDNLNSDYSRKLRIFLKSTMAEQTQFMTKRLEAALPKMLKTVKNGFTRQKIREDFYHVAMQKNGVYALMDYVNFKGEGTSLNERYNNQGWGLLQVLENMRKDENIMHAFIESADLRLTRRVANALSHEGKDESQWLRGWRKRLQTYAN